MHGKEIVFIKQLGRIKKIIFQKKTWSMLMWITLMSTYRSEQSATTDKQNRLKSVELYILLSG